MPVKLAKSMAINQMLHIIIAARLGPLYALYHIARIKSEIVQIKVKANIQAPHRDSDIARISAFLNSPTVYKTLGQTEAAKGLVKNTALIVSVYNTRIGSIPAMDSIQKKLKAEKEMREIMCSLMDFILFFLRYK